MMVDQTQVQIHGKNLSRTLRLLVLVVSLFILAIGCAETADPAGAEGTLASSNDPSLLQDAISSLDTEARSDFSSKDSESTESEDTYEEPEAIPDTAIETPPLTEDGGIAGSNIYPPKEIPETLGESRPANVLVPLDYTPEKLWPLVISLHGYGMTPESMDATFKLSAQVTAKGVVLVTPQGTENIQGDPFWNSADCCNLYGAEVDDMGYLMSLIDEAEETLSIDPEQIYLFGLSNGAFMAYELACTYPDRFAGIVAVAGMAPKKDDNCIEGGGVGVLHVHGTLDALVPYPGSFKYQSVAESNDEWIARNGCNPDSPLIEEEINYDYMVPGNETTKLTWQDCESGKEVALWKMFNSAHVPYFHPDFTPACLDWILGQSSNPSPE